MPDDFGFQERSQLGAYAVTRSVPTFDKTGREVLAVIAKLSFDVDPSGAVRKALKPSPIDLTDTYHGEEPAKASIRRPSQLFESKPGTDVVLLGHAHPPRDRSAEHVDVALRFGRVSKTVRAYGLRVWQLGTFGGLRPGPARPLRDPVPLIYELAWGGADVSDEKRPLAEPRNPVGRGVARDLKALVDRPAAQLEDPAHPIDGKGAWPAAFNPIHRHWQPRLSYGGTYDEAWKASRMPFLPLDFDERFHVSVAPDQWSEAPLRGDEPVEILNATPDGAWRFELPRVVPGISSKAFGARTDHRTHLDTVLIDADAGRVELTWRAAVPLPRKYEMLDEVTVVEKTVV